MYYVFYFYRLAFSYLKDYQKASSCYKKACELDPSNQGYQRNYQLSLTNLQTNSGTSQQSPIDPSILGNPNLMETAARMMTENPEVSSVYAIVFTRLFLLLAKDQCLRNENHYSTFFF